MDQHFLLRGDLTAWPSLKLPYGGILKSSLIYTIRICCLAATFHFINYVQLRPNGIIKSSEQNYKT